MIDRWQGAPGDYTPADATALARELDVEPWPDEPPGEVRLLPLRHAWRPRGRERGGRYAGRLRLVRYVSRCLRVGALPYR